MNNSEQATSEAARALSKRAWSKCPEQMADAARRNLRKAWRGRSEKAAKRRKYRRAAARAEGLIKRPVSRVWASDKPYHPVRTPIYRDFQRHLYWTIVAAGDQGLTRHQILTMIAAHHEESSGRALRWYLAQTLCELRKRGLIREEEGSGRDAGDLG